MSRSAATLGVVLSLVVVRAGLTTQSPARTGLVVGQVVDATTRAPLADAVVTLQPSPTLADVTPFRERVLTDAQGQFFFDRVPAGGYLLTADKPGFVGGAFGKARHDGVALTFELGNDERRADARILLWKFAALGGTLVDEFGDPMPGVRVQALRRTTIGGRPSYGTNGAANTSITDDRGHYRMFLLPPGDYIVVVQSTQTTMPAAVVSQYFEQRTSATQTEVFAATSEISTLGSPRNQQIGDAVLMTQSGMPVPGAPNDAGQVETYQTTFYPAATRAQDAAIVALQPGDERSWLNIQLRPIRSVRVSGRLVGPSGPLTPTALRLTPVNASGTYAVAAGGTSTSIGDTVTGVSGAGGAFTLIGVPPGQYLLKVQSPVLKPLLWAVEPLTVGDADIKDLVITVRASTHVTGRLVDAGATADPEALSGRDVTFERANADPPRITARTDAQGRFAADLPPGEYVVRLSGSSRWPRSITAGGKDVTDTPFEVKADALDVVITLTDRQAQLSGTVRDPSGGPDPQLFVVVFPIDRAGWTNFGSLSGSRRMRTARTGRGGSFIFRDLAPGNYFVAAMPESAIGDWSSPARLETLSRSAERVVLNEGEQKQVDVRTVVR